MMEMKQLLAAGFVLALIIGVSAVFFASGDPDGLESTALFVQDEKTLTGDSPEDGDPEAVGTGEFEYEAPLPDYGMGENMGSTGEIIAIVAGILVALIVVFGVAKAATAMKG